MNTMRSMERGNGCKSTESQVKVHKTKEQVKIIGEIQILGSAEMEKCGKRKESDHSGLT